jgi:thioredoxin 1
MKVLKFEASWCQPCKMLTRIVGDMKDQLTVPFDPIDIDENADLAKQYGIRGVPTLVLIGDDGIEIKRKSGVLREAELLEFIKQ